MKGLLGELVGATHTPPKGRFGDPHPILLLVLFLFLFVCFFLLSDNILSLST